MKKKPEERVPTRRLSIDYVPIEVLNPNAYNPNVHDAESFDLLVQSLKIFGFTQPIVVDRRTREIVDGENRWRAACVLNMTEVPVCYVDLTDGERKCATIMHNRARGREVRAQIEKIESELDPGLLDEVLLRKRRRQKLPSYGGE